LSSEEIDAELKRLVQGLIPIVKGRVLLSSLRSPENFQEELGTLASLYAIRANLHS
jgi:hypothetical protein